MVNGSEGSGFSGLFARGIGLSAIPASRCDEYLRNPDRPKFGSKSIPPLAWDGGAPSPLQPL